MSRVVSCGRTERRAGLMKLVVAFRHFANAPKTLIVYTVKPRYSATYFTAVFGGTTKYVIQGISVRRLTCAVIKGGAISVADYVCNFFLNNASISNVDTY